MNDEQYKALLRLIFLADPIHGQWALYLRHEFNVLCDLADAEAKKRGWQDWQEAYHETTKPIKEAE
jgi:hypothetical protein